MPSSATKTAAEASCARRARPNDPSGRAQQRGEARRGWRSTTTTVEQDPPCYLDDDIENHLRQQVERVVDVRRRHTRHTGGGVDGCIDGLDRFEPPVELVDRPVLERVREDGDHGGEACSLGGEAAAALGG